MKWSCLIVVDVNVFLEFLLEVVVHAFVDVVVNFFLEVILNYYSMSSFILTLLLS